MTVEPNPSESKDQSQIVRDHYWQAGFEDGTIGQTWLEHRRVLQAEAEQDKAAEIAGIEQRLENAKAELAIVRGEVEREQQDFDRLAQQLHDATQDRDGSPTQYSRPMGWFFILCSAFIIFADFPLSRTISEQILTEHAAAFFSHTTFVALGIVAMGLFFKIVADPFTRPRYLLPRYVRPITWVVTAVLALLLAAALAGVLGMLGIFRGDTVTGSHDDTSTTFIYGASDTAAPTMTAPTTTAGGPAATLRRELDALEIGFVSKVAFLALALVLPILGGIFLSTGAARLHNAKHIDRLQKLYPDRRSVYEGVTRRQHAAMATIATLERERTVALGRRTLANSRYHRYLHGYERGICTAASDAGISNDVRAFVSRWLVAARQRESMLRTQAVAETHSDFNDHDPGRRP